MLARSILVIALYSGVATGQLSGRLYLEKETFAPGEPIFLYSEVVNPGPDAVTASRADPYSFCAGYQIHLSSDKQPTSSCAMGGGWAGSCLSSSAEFRHGEKRTERILLNFDHAVDAPGDYDVQAKRSLPYGNAEDFFTPNRPTLELQTLLHFRIDPNASFDVHKLDIFVAQLQSKDREKRMEAARTLAVLAPQSLEQTLLGFADDPLLKYFAPLAFHHLNTPRSMSAMADLLRKSEPGSSEYMDSARYLAESDDPQWFPLLLEAAQKNPKMSNYVDDAAESGEAKMLPYLFEWMRSSDTEFTRPNAISALGYTGSREAVPALIELLHSPETSTAQRALWGLRQLTHFSLGGGRWLDEPQTQYSKWLQWWARDGAKAHIYKAQECGEITPLP